jgi:serine/threonine-protein kinase RsbW
MGAALGTARPQAGTDFFSPELDRLLRGIGQNDSGPARDSHHRAVTAACRVFAAQPLQVALARRFVAGVLTGLGPADDVVLCVSELASNAVLHSHSREPGGQFVVRTGMTATGRIRAEIEDRGGPWAPDPDQNEERGRGLLIVAGLATRWGIVGNDAGRVAWLELDPA